jgi:hypothetical protein
MHWLLYSFITLCLSAAWDQLPYSGFAIATRLIDCIGWSHALRTVAYMITVLPNPRPHCYARRFPPVPDTVWEFIKIGMWEKRGNGCNDLVISGHGVVYAVVPLALQTFYPIQSMWRRGGVGLGSPAFWGWCAVLKLCIQETLDKTHYSVDMLLAVAVTALVWVWRGEKLYRVPGSEWVKRGSGAVADPVPVWLIGTLGVVLVIVFLGVHGV